jgi:DNA-binding transcriptional LysR family regulator
MQFGSSQALGIEDLAQHPFIKLDGRGPLGRLLSAYIQSGTIEINPVAFAETYHVAKALVSQGTGVTITDEITARSGGSSNIRIWPLDPPLQFRVCILRMDNMPLSLVCQNFVSHLKVEVLKFLNHSGKKQKLSSGSK